MEDTTETGNLTDKSQNRSSSANDKLFVISKCKRTQKNPTDTSTSNENQETTEDTDTEERLLTVYWRSGRLGAATYVLHTGELEILEEIVDRPPEHQIFTSLYNQVEPSKLIIDKKTPSTFASVVKKVVFSDTSEESRCKLIYISNREYNFEACKRRIYNLSFPHEPANCTEEERVCFLRTMIDFTQLQSMHALGALLRYLDLNWSNLSLDLHGKPEFLMLKRISLKNIVTIDEDTYRGLQIFSSVSHPSNFKKGVQGANKEGLSLFQLFSKCSSKVGHRRMRSFLRNPTTDLEILRKRQDAIAFFMKPHSDSILRNVCSSLRFIKNVNGILTKIKALSAKAYQWKSLYNTLYNAVLICEICENVATNVEYLEDLASHDTNKLFEMALYMNRIIDFDLSKTENKFTVKAGVDRDLDLKKQTMASLHGLMSETAKVEIERLPSFVEECTMLYMPHLGYLLGVKAWAENLTMEEKELPNMRFMFQNDDYIHYKSKGCEELDTMIGDTYPEIVAHETRIMMRLTAIILDNLTSLAAVVDKCADLDCLITISKVCRELSFVRPTLTSDKTIEIKQGRHPLYVSVCDSFVANDFYSSAEEGYVKIITGPNSSGKSVYMKQIGLIVYLAHVGSFVPAEKATIGVVSSLYSRIHSTECVAAHMSAFLIDLRQMSLVIQESHSNSLVLVDEFGKGTAETDGLALLAACTNTLLFRERLCPHIVLSTHFLNIKEFIVDTPIVKFLRLEHTLHEGEVVFLYTVVGGGAPHSFGGEVALASGISAHVIARAKLVMDAIANNCLPQANTKIINKLKECEKIIPQLVTDEL